MRDITTMELCNRFLKEITRRQMKLVRISLIGEIPVPPTKEEESEDALLREIKKAMKKVMRERVK